MFSQILSTLIKLFARFNSNLKLVKQKSLIDSFLDVESLLLQCLLFSYINIYIWSKRAVCIVFEARPVVVLSIQNLLAVS